MNSALAIAVPHIMINDEFTLRIVAIVRGFLVKRGADRAIRPDEDLRDAGLTSVDMVNLMLALESAFSVLIPEEKMLPENFATVRAIGELVGALEMA